MISIDTLKEIKNRSYDFNKIARNVYENEEFIDYYEISNVNINLLVDMAIIRYYKKTQKHYIIHTIVKKILTCWREEESNFVNYIVGFYEGIVADIKWPEDEIEKNLTDKPQRMMELE